jgi:hypothetical protein
MWHVDDQSGEQLATGIANYPRARAVAEAYLKRPNKPAAALVWSDSNEVFKLTLVDGKLVETEVPNKSKLVKVETAEEVLGVLKPAVAG